MRDPKTWSAMGTVAGLAGLVVLLLERGGDLSFPGAFGLGLGLVAIAWLMCLSILARLRGWPGGR